MTSRTPSRPQDPCARLLLWTYPHPLPANEASAWGQYQAIWPPGRPHPRQRRRACWGVACEAYPLAG